MSTLKGISSNAFNYFENLFLLGDSEVLYVFWLFISVTISLSYRALAPKLSIFNRHIFLTLFGIFIVYNVFGGYAIYLMLNQIIISLTFLWLLPQRYAKYFATTIAFLICLYSHYLKFGIRVQLDHTRPMMLQTGRLVFFILNYNFKSSEETFLRFASYLLSAPTVLAGPFLFYNEYIFTVEDTSQLTLESQSDREEFEKRKEEISRTAWKKPFWKALVLSFFHLAVVLYFREMPEMVDFFPQDNFIDSSFFMKIFYIIIMPAILRHRYYFAWTLAEASVIAAGFGFSGFHKDSREPEFENAKNIRWMKFEISTSIKDQWAHWNIGTLRWLKTCFYQQLKGPWNVLLTFFISALWHGIDASYYACFGSALIATFVTRIAHQRVRRFFINNRITHLIYNILTTIGTILFTDFIGITFKLSSAKNVFIFWKACYWLPFAILAIIFGVSISFNKPSKRPSEETVANGYHISHKVTKAQ